MVSPIKERGIGIAFLCFTSEGKGAIGGKNRTEENTGGESKGGAQKERGPLADVRFGKKESEVIMWKESTNILYMKFLFRIL